MIAEFWDQILSRTPERLKSLVPDLRKFLSLQSNLLAEAFSLVDKTSVRPLTNTDAEHLEALVINQVRLGSLSKQDAADWLKILFIANRVFDEHQIKLPPTRLADLPPPATSPFSPAHMKQANLAAVWREVLLGWLKETRGTGDEIMGLAASLISAVLFGGLLDKAKLLNLAENPQNPLLVARRNAYFEFSLPYQGKGDTHLQRWFPDPLTELLWSRISRNISGKKTKEILRDIQRFFENANLSKTLIPSTLDAFIDSASCLWNTECSPLELHSVQRQFLAHSIKTDTWLRIQGCNVRQQTPLQKLKSVKTPSSGEQDSSVDEDISLLYQHLDLAIAALDLRDPISQLDQILASPDCVAPASTYIGWLKFMLGGKKGSEANQFQIKGAKGLFNTAVMPLIGLLGDEDPAERSSEELFSLYREIIEEKSSGRIGDKQARSLQRFHHYLHAEFGHDRLTSVRETLGDEYGMNSVDARIITPDEYQDALAWLSNLDLQGCPKEQIAMARVVLILAFRTGMRRMEIFGLLLADIKIGQNTDCLVREHGSRRLKTNNARRCLPLNLLLATDELDEFLRWFELKTAKHKDADKGNERNHSGSNRASPVVEDFLFVPEDALHWRTTIEPTVKRIHEAIRGVSGNQLLRMHHLRHSFGTWAYLRLRAADCPEIVEMFAHLPVSASELKGSARFRQALLGLHDSPSRIYAFAIAKLLGHSSPAVSMAHYIHGSDIVLSAICRRNLQAIPEQYLSWAAGINYRSGKRFIEQGLDALLQRGRVKNAHRYQIFPRNDAPCSVVAAKNCTLVREVGKFASLESVRSLLFRLSEKDPEPTLIERFRIEPLELSSAVSMAEKYAKTIYIDSSKGYCPPPPRLSGEKSISQILESCLASLYLVDKAGLAKGLELYLEHYDRDTMGIVFKGLAEADQAKKIIDFFTALGFSESDMLFVLRHSNTTTPPKSWRAWKKALELSKNVRLRIITAKNEKASYSRWIEIRLSPQVSEENGSSSFPKAIVRTFFLARVALEISK